ncbi:MAG: TRAP transporter large permease [Peptococcaceae bacterium]
MLALLFVILIIALLLGIPVSFSIGISAMTYILVEGQVPPIVVVQNLIKGANSYTMLALPLFIFSGAIMVYGTTPRLLRFANMILGRIPGGLGAAGVTACAFFGAISGSGVATTAAIGSIIAPEMVEKGYQKGFTASLIAGAGVLGGVIPPSLTFVVYAQAAGVSIGDMFLAGIIPGFICAAMLALLCIIFARKKGWGLAGKEEIYRYTAKNRIIITLDALAPLMMPVIILGGVFSGIITPTESAVIATVYAFILAVFVYRELSLKEFIGVAANSAVSSAVIMLIIAFANPFGWILTTRNMASTIANSILQISSNPAVIYVLIAVVLVFLGTFMEGFSIIILTTSIFLPVMKHLGISPIAYGAVLCMAIAIGGVTPPLAVCLFTSCRILKMRIEETIPDVFWILAVMIFATGLVMIFPQMATFLPTHF